MDGMVSKTLKDFIVEYKIKESEEDSIMKKVNEWEAKVDGINFLLSKSRSEVFFLVGPSKL
jgi:hypothetical protein